MSPVKSDGVKKPPKYSPLSDGSIVLISSPETTLRASYDSITLTLDRNGSTLTVTATLGELPGSG